MNVVVICERSGVVRDAFIRRGYQAISVDLEATDAPGPHYQGDALEFLRRHARDFDLMIAHPPCTATGVSGNGTYADTLARHDGVRFAERVWCQPIPRRVLEHPISVLTTQSRILVDGVVQYLHPWQFGHRETKQTVFFRKGLPALTPTDIVGPPPPQGSPERKAWERVWRMPPGPDRSRLRGVTYPGIGDALAEQYGRLGPMQVNAAWIPDELQQQELF